ncbi:hypothetical protein SAMN05216410_2416 [Sanguibacter gelidistatuariae]|uniref:DUF559 domain-containing protein n=1 Tax=Sanguibacter gelidistatuariae TaxID=1814289 RepID=A0A1G6Q1P9_9MICO|nr:hypothetical protein [Sanguibacter gelidistatuariae]SDC86269.1 hypothetical protein SAMN05216410_2416 [Sanguibacter gelidistatuariae]
MVTPLYRGWAWLHPPTPTDSPARAAHARTTARIAAVHAGLRTEHWFCGESAALIHGCDTVDLDGSIHLIQRHNQQRGAHPEVKRHTAALRADEMTVVDGIPVTSLARSVVDCARTLSERQALVIADSALRRGLSVDDLESALLRARGSRGICKACSILPLADARAESPGESLLRLVVVRGGLPAPELQIAVDTHLGRRYVDLGWSDLKVAVEFDGRIKYTTDGGGADQAFYDEKRRQDALEELGWLVVRVMWEDLYNPAALVARLWDALRRQQRRRTFT